MSCHISSPHLTSHCLTSPHLTYPHVTLLHHVMSPNHITTSRHITSPLMSDRVMSSHITSPNVTSCYFDRTKATRFTQFVFFLTCSCLVLRREGEIYRACGFNQRQFGSFSLSASTGVLMLTQSCLAYWPFLPYCKCVATCQPQAAFIIQPNTLQQTQ